MKGSALAHGGAGRALLSVLRYYGVVAAVAVILDRVHPAWIYRITKQRRGCDEAVVGGALAGPESAGSAIAVGDPRLLAAMAPGELPDVAERMARMERYIEARRKKDKKKRPSGLLIVHTDNEVAATATAEPVLDEMSSWWRLAEIVPAEGGTSLLEYLARARQEVSAATRVEAVRDRGEPVTAAEYRSLKGLKKRL